MNDIHLNLINQSNDENNSSVLILHKNDAGPQSAQSAVAWKVIQNLGKGSRHSFVYSFKVQVSAEDSYGNVTPVLDAKDGQAFEMIRDDSGDVLRLAPTPSSDPNAVEVRNNLDNGAITALFYRSGSVDAKWTGLPPGDLVDYTLNKPSIFLGVVSQVTEGETLDAAIVSRVECEIDLTGILCADIIWSGGGPGANALPFSFQLSNVTRR